MGRERRTTSLPTRHCQMMSFSQDVHLDCTPPLRGTSVQSASQAGCEGLSGGQLHSPRAGLASEPWKVGSEALPIIQRSTGTNPPRDERPSALRQAPSKDSISATASPQAPHICCGKGAKLLQQCPQAPPEAHLGGPITPALSSVSRSLRLPGTGACTAGAGSSEPSPAASLAPTKHCPCADSRPGGGSEPLGACGEPHRPQAHV